eukprot:5613271-Karenia_brevis.AAC.1
MESPVPEEMQDGKLTQEVRDKQNDIPFIWPIEFGGDTNLGERMRAFDNFNEMKARWQDMPISEYQDDYDMIAF